MADHPNRRLRWCSRRSHFRTLDGYEQLERRQMLTSISFPIKHLIDEVSGEGLIETADINGDQNVDIVVVTDRLSWYRNEGGGRFGDPIEIDTDGTVIRQLSTLDIDLDGDTDLFVIHRDRVVWLENLDGAGTFSQPNELIAEEATAADFGDLDHDGDRDLVVLVVGRRESGVWTYENLDGRMSLGPGYNVFETRGFDSDSAVVVADLNHDGNLDIASSAAAIRWHEYVGGDIGYLTHETDGYRRHSRFIGGHDVDNDGDIDIVASAIGERLVWYENTDGLGGFTERHRIARSQPHANHRVADLDGDGDVDFLTADVERPTVEWHDNADRGLVIKGGIPITTETAPRSTSYVDVADVDHDGDVDIIYWAEGAMYWQENRRVGDSNNDGAFDSRDLVEVFAAGKYDNGVPGSAVYDEGDWNQDGVFDSADLVFAFQAGTYRTTVQPADNEIEAAVESLFADNDETRAIQKTVGTSF